MKNAILAERPHLKIFVIFVYVLKIIWFFLWDFPPYTFNNYSWLNCLHTNQRLQEKLLALLFLLFLPEFSEMDSILTPSFIRNLNLRFTWNKLCENVAVSTQAAGCGCNIKGDISTALDVGTTCVEFTIATNLLFHIIVDSIANSCTKDRTTLSKFCYNWSSCCITTDLFPCAGIWNTLILFDVNHICLNSLNKSLNSSTLSW